MTLNLIRKRSRNKQQNYSQGGIEGEAYGEHPDGRNTMSKALGEGQSLIHLRNQKVTVVAGAVKSWGSGKQMGRTLV